MNQQLKQAIAAARAGKKPQAKVLLARVIKDEPENVNAWYLLSSLADTEEQKIQHLQKVLELQPDHPAASEQLVELVPAPPEPVEEVLLETVDDTMEYKLEIESEPATESVAPPEVEQPLADVPDEPDEAMAWLEKLAADQGASLDELPSLSEETAEPEIEAPIIDYEEPEPALESDVPEDPDEAMAWLEQLAADQGASLDELPTVIDSEVADETAAEIEDDFSWLDEEPSEPDIDLETMPATIDEQEPEAGDGEEETAKTLTVSDDFDFVSQSKGDSIPAWLAGEEDYIAADAVVADSPEEEAEQPEPETLPDWLNDESLEGWVGEEGEKSGQVVWKAGEGDESLKPTPPAAEKEAPQAKKQTAAPRDNTNLKLTILSLFALVLFVAIILVLIYQPF